MKDYLSRTMKRRTFGLFAMAAALLIGTSGAKADTVQKYTGFLGATPIKVTIIWDNIKGLGDISGSISYGGRKLGFSGSNYASGKIRFVDSDGYTYSMYKSNSGSTIGWKGTCGGEQVTFTRSK